MLIEEIVAAFVPMEQMSCASMRLCVITGLILLEIKLD